MSGSGPKQRLKDLDAQLAFTLERQAIDAVVDVGANAGQYAARLRAAGWRGPILSIEPIPELRDALSLRAGADPAWEVAPAIAMGAVAGEVALDVSAESDMSSTLAQSPLLRDVSPTSAVLRRIVVPQRRLDGLDLVVARPEPVQAGLQLELALLPLYDGEAPWLEPVADLAARGFAPYLLFPGYFSRALGRQVQLDVVFYRA